MSNNYRVSLDVLSYSGTTRCYVKWECRLLHLVKYTSMLTGADVSGCKYSGCSKCPVCAVNILITRIGSRFAWRAGSKGVNKNATAPGRELVPSVASGISLRSLIRSAAVTGRKSFIGKSPPLFVMRSKLTFSGQTFDNPVKCYKHKSTSLSVPWDC